MKVIVFALNGCPAGWLGAYGNDWVGTPHLDRLAAEAVTFDRHISDRPEPTAARAAWMGRPTPPAPLPEGKGESSVLPSPLAGEGGESEDRVRGNFACEVSFAWSVLPNTPHPSAKRRHPLPQGERARENPVDNVARKWRASLSNRRALVAVPNAEQRPESARHRITKARHPRAKLFTGGRSSETLAGPGIRGRRGECAPERAFTLLLLLDV